MFSAVITDLFLDTRYFYKFSRHAHRNKCVNYIVLKVYYKNDVNLDNKSKNKYNIIMKRRKKKHIMF